MRILIGSPATVSLLGGGLRTQVLALQRALTQLGHEAVLFDPWSTVSNGCDWFYLVGAHLGTLHLARAVRQAGMRLAVSPVFFSRHSPAGLRVRITGARWAERIFRLRSEGTITREICQLADIVLPNTRAEAGLVIRGLGVNAAKVRVVPNGVDERFSQATPDAFVRQYALRNFVLYVGPVGSGRKRLLDLIQVMSRIDRPLVIIGQVLATDYARMCLSAARSLKQCLVLPPVANDSELLAAAYAACDTFCLPSLFETPGLAALEAGLAGAKLVITRYGGTQEYFGSYARYITPGNRQELQRALAESVAAPKDDRLREHIRQHFLWPHAGTILVEVLRLPTDRQE